jgi:hypothetical protein
MPGRRARPGIRRLEQTGKRLLALRPTRCEAFSVSRAVKIGTWSASAIVVAGLVALATPAVVGTVTAAAEGASNVARVLATPTAATTPAVDPPPTEPLTQLPEWALVSVPWIVYPEGFECFGTEGCPNDYRAAFGEPGEVLPVGVEYYDPAWHGVRERPAEQ